MPRAFEFTVPYESPPVPVHATLTNPAFWHAMFEGAANATVETTSDGPGTITVAMAEHVGRAAIPAPLQKIVKGDLVLTHTDTWAALHGDRADGVFEGGSARGTTGKIGGTMLLRPDGDGSILEVAGTVEVSMRIVGSMLEKLVAQMLTKGFEGKRNCVEKWIARPA